MSESVDCELCGETIGVYEPLITFIDGHPQETSRAATHPPGGLPSPCFHQLCFEGQQAEEPPLCHQDLSPGRPRAGNVLTT